MNRTVQQLQQISSCVLLSRSFATRSKNLYQILGLERGSTSNEIKGAYYKLSMLYHPDKNGSNVDAAEKFREITEAYEVLGNFRLRKLYDKGIHTPGGRALDPRPQEPTEEDDATTRFYKARMNKESRTATGRTPIYDFDEWTNAHYGDEFKRQQKLKRDTKRKQYEKEATGHGMQIEYTMFALLILVVLYASMAKNSPDIDRTMKEKLKKE